MPRPLDPRRRLAGAVAAACVALTGACALALPGLAPAESGSAVRFAAHMVGPEQIPGPGDRNAAGYLNFTFDAGRRSVCWRLSKVRGMDAPATLAHIHSGAKGEMGPIVVQMFNRSSRERAAGCGRASTKAIRAIQARPFNFYASLHSREHITGAVRGQLRAVRR